MNTCGVYMCSVCVPIGNASSASLLVASGHHGAAAALPGAADSAASNTEYNRDTHNLQNKGFSLTVKRKAVEVF